MVAAGCIGGNLGGVDCVDGEGAADVLAAGGCSVAGGCTVAEFTDDGAVVGVDAGFELRWFVVFPGGTRGL